MAARRKVINVEMVAYFQDDGSGGYNVELFKDFDHSYQVLVKEEGMPYYPDYKGAKNGESPYDYGELTELEITLIETEPGSGKFQLKDKVNFHFGQ